MTLDQELALWIGGKVAIVGVGDDGRADDGVGPLVARLLADTGFQTVIDSGSSPELDTWRLRDLMPDSVLFLDAVDFGGSPGEVSLLSPNDLRSSGFDTHRAPLKLTMQYLENDLGCRCLLLAVQPKDVRRGAGMCGEVKRSAAILAEALMNAMPAHMA